MLWKKAAMRKNLLSVLLALLPRIMQKFAFQQQGYKNIAQLRMKLLYLRIIKICRWLFLSFLGIGVCLVFLFSSIILFNFTVFFYVPCSMGIKMWLGFLSAAVYLLIAMGAFTFVFTESKWLRMFNAQNMLKNPQVNKHD
jgi:hypothetical protein